MSDQIYLTIEQINELHHLANTTRTRYGKVMVGIEIRGDDMARSSITAVAAMSDLDNCVTIIEPDGASPGWER